MSGHTFDRAYLFGENTDGPAFGGMDPNSEHQRWSRWIFGIQAGRKLPRTKEVIDNARSYFAKGFKSHSGRVRCDRQGTFYSIIIEIEGPPAHDPKYMAFVRKDFIDRFMHSGFGSSARLTKFDVAVLAGDQQEGRPPDQMLVIPQLNFQPQLMGDASHG